MIVAPMDFARLPIITMIGALLYGEVIDVYLAIGAVFILAGNGVNLWSQKRRA